MESYLFTFRGVFRYPMKGRKNKPFPPAGPAWGRMWGADRPLSAAFPWPSCCLAVTAALGAKDREGWSVHLDAGGSRAPERVSALLRLQWQERIKGWSPPPPGDVNQASHYWVFANDSPRFKVSGLKSGPCFGKTLYCGTKAL